MWENLKNYQTLSICPFLSDFLGHSVILKECYVKHMTAMINVVQSCFLEKRKNSDPNPTLSEVLLIHLHDI